jgi:cytoskeletal protein CcmA (bactofilin family)
MWAFGTSQPVTVTGQDNFTFLGKDAMFKGVLTLEGDIRVDGRLEGELRSTGTLIVGEHAVIRGNIMAGILITSGKINGDVIASERIKILKPGIVVGDIRTPAISIEAGAFFHGLSDMGANQWIEDRSTIHENVLDLPVHRERLRAQGY